MKKTLLLFTALFLTGCASNPYGTGRDQGYFLNQSNITSNVPNLCTASNQQYAFVAHQYWLTGGAGTTWYGCTAAHQADLQPEYMIDYSIIKNDGTGKNVVARCTPVFNGKGKNLHFTQMDVVIQLRKHPTPPSCEVVLSTN